MDAFQRAQRMGALRRQMARQRQAPPPIPRRASPVMRTRSGRQLFGAETGLGAVTSPDVMYGMVPMAVVVGVGLWMALRG
jgi:hypothetical protein